MNIIALVSAINILLAVVGVFLVYRLAKKLQHPSPWMAFVPIANLFLWLSLGNIKHRNLFWILALAIPIVNIVAFFVFLWINIQCAINICERAQHRKLFTLLLLSPGVQLWALWELGNEQKNPTAPSLPEQDQAMLQVIRSELEKGATMEQIVVMMKQAHIDDQKIKDLFHEVHHPSSPTPKQHSTGFILGLFVVGIIIGGGMSVLAQNAIEARVEQMFQSQFSEEYMNDFFNGDMSDIEEELNKQFEEAFSDIEITFE